MKTVKQQTIAQYSRYLAVLGMSGAETSERLAKLIVGAASGRSAQQFAEQLALKCQETDQVLVRTSGMDVVIYGPKGYAVIDYTAGYLDVAKRYPEGESFATATRYAA
jgi:hypothetical protein